MEKPFKLVLIVVLACLMGCTSATATKESVEDLYIKRCSGCHGVDGEPMKLNAPDFTDAEFQKSRSDEQFRVSILEGKDKMPGYKTEFDNEQVAALIAYIRTMAKEKK
ncbi:MAG: cytochrome c [Blastocatellia bacterium]|nr:cytochrome c [Blastocatellia bacterium]